MIGYLISQLDCPISKSIQNWSGKRILVLDFRKKSQGTVLDIVEPSCEWLTYKLLVVWSR